jgi:hypothetical protein
MKKLISISTTVRSPYRIPYQLKVIKKYFEGKKWNNDTMPREFMYRIIQEKAYSPSLNKLNQSDQNKYEISETLEYDFAKKIFNKQNYADPFARSRYNFDPIRKLGFVNTYNGYLKVTASGNELIEKEENVSEIFLKSLLKWQLPNFTQLKDYKPDDGYNIIPLIGFIKLIKSLNTKYEKSVGISRKEISIFLPSLLDINDIDGITIEILEFREKFKKIKNKKDKSSFIEETYRKFSKKNEFKNPYSTSKDYGDNLRRYFCYTDLFKDNGFYVNLNEYRQSEIKEILSKFTGEALRYDNLNAYLDNLNNNNSPPLNSFKSTLNDFDNIVNIAVRKSKNEENLLIILNEINNLIKKKEVYGMGIDAERLIYRLMFLIDSFEKFNAPVKNLDSEGLPRSTAPGNGPDLIVNYKNFDLIIETTTLLGKSQKKAEDESVPRHLNDHINKTNKNTYCIFIAPFIDKDLIKVYQFYSNPHENAGYESRKLSIIPINLNVIKEFIENCLKNLNNINFSEEEFEQLLQSMDVHFSKQSDWLLNIENNFKTFNSKIL